MFRMKDERKQPTIPNTKIAKQEYYEDAICLPAIIDNEQEAQYHYTSYMHPDGSSSSALQRCTCNHRA